MNTQNVKTAAQESSRKMKGNTMTASIVALPMAFYQPSHSRVWDYAVQCGGEWRTRQNGQTLAELQETFPDMELIGSAEAVARENEPFRSPWAEISEARYIDQLEVQRVVDWCRSSSGESFKSMEVIGGDVTSIFFRREGRFFECSDLETLSHDELAVQIGEQFFARNSVNFGH